MGCRDLAPKPFRRLLALAPLVLVCACATAPGSRPKPVVKKTESGFTISEKVRVGLGVRSRFDRALALIEAGELEAGIALLEEVTAEAPNLTAAHIDLGIAHRMAGELESAEKSLKTALELSPRHPVAHNELGIVQRRTGRFEEARSSYERALATYPDFHFARRNLAILCDVYIGDLACAIEHYELYVKANPRDEDAAMWITDLRRRVGR